jgi:ferredoxin-NADP reductase
MRSKVLLIGGGIGITPLRSMAAVFTKNKKDTVLLYGARTATDIAFRSEFDTLSTAGLRTHYILSTPTEGYESGYLDQEKLLRLVPDFHERDIFICGPAPMMDATITLLRKLGVTQDHLHYEKFSM